MPLPRVLPFVISVLLSVIVLFTPESGVPSAPPGTDKVVHCLLFALLTATGLRARIPGLLVGLAGYAALSEVLQELVVPLHRSGDLVDALTDVAGIGLGWLVTSVVRARRCRRHTSR